MANDIDPRGLRNLPDGPATIKASRTFFFTDTDMVAAIEDFKNQLSGEGMTAGEVDLALSSIRSFFECEGRAREKLVFSPAREITLSGNPDGDANGS